MDIKTNDQNGSVNVWPEKLQTQQEINPSQIQAEVKLADTNKILEKNLVAGLVRKSNRILVTITTHRFPFDLFPDTINVEEERITVIRRNFFFSSQVHSVDIKDISNIFINMAPFFAQLVIVSNTFKENEIKIKNLKKEEAVFTRRIIEGLRIFQNKQIDTSNYTKDDLIVKLGELSTTEIVT